LGAVIGINLLEQYKLFVPYQAGICAIQTLGHTVGTYLTAVYHNGGRESFVKSDPANRIYRIQYKPLWPW